MKDDIKDNLYTLIELPLIKSHEDNLTNLWDIIDIYVKRNIINIDEDIAYFKKRLFSCYYDIMSMFLKYVVLPRSLNIKGYKVIYRINPKDDFKSELIITDEINLDDHIMQISMGSIINICGEESSNHSLSIKNLILQKYMLIKIILDFNDFYKKYGVINSTRIEIMSNDFGISSYINKK